MYSLIRNQGSKDQNRSFRPNHGQIILETLRPNWTGTSKKLVTLDRASTKTIFGPTRTDRSVDPRSGTEQYQIITDYCPDKFVNTNFEGRKYNGFTQYWKEGDWGEGSNWDDDALVPLPVDPTGAIATLNQPTLENSNPGKTNLATNECLYFRLVFEILIG